MNILARYSKIFEGATAAGNPDTEKSLAGWHKRACIKRNALLELKREHLKELDSLRDTYAPKVFEERRTELDAAYNTVVARVKDRLTEDLNAVLEGKRKQFDKSTGAPTEEQLRLLTALNMRSNLSAADIAQVSDKFQSNIQALQVLKDISAKHGIPFPDVGNVEAFEESMTRAEQFSLDKLNSIDTDHDDLGYRDMLFWEHPGDGEAMIYYGNLDGQGFSAEQITDATNEAQQETATRSTAPKATETGEGEPLKMWAEVRCPRNTNIGIIATQFHTSAEAIRKANPEKDLDRIHGGEKILVPATRFTFQPSPNGTHVQPEDVKAVPRPIYPEPTGPNGESVGDDIEII